MRFFKPLESNPRVTVRPLMHIDIPDVCAAATEFFQESSFRKQTLRIDKYAKMLTDYIGNTYVQSFVCYMDNELAGYIHIYCQDDYTDELIGELYQFYVRKKFRGKGIARMLVDAADVKWAQWGCVKAYADANPGFDDSGLSVKLFQNLWGKFGFKSTGQSFMKEYP